SKSLRLDYLQYKELLQMTQLRAGALSKEAEGRLKRGEVINQLIIQEKNKPVSLEEQVLYLYALNKGLLDNLSISQIKRFKNEILSFVNKNYPEFCSSLRSTHELTEEMKKALDNCFKLYFDESLK
ncbi:MAG: hypothetical protein NC903_02660, partial [Candidatus Omnitrophica bacterium]|nr:hypothetical protein [Candidatus Omnitrophota bacterium]